MDEAEMQFKMATLQRFVLRSRHLAEKGVGWQRLRRPKTGCCLLEVCPSLLDRYRFFKPEGILSPLGQLETGLQRPVQSTDVSWQTA